MCGRGDFLKNKERELARISCGKTVHKVANLRVVIQGLDELCRVCPQAKNCDKPCEIFSRSVNRVNAWLLDYYQEKFKKVG